MAASKNLTKPCPECHGSGRVPDAAKVGAKYKARRTAKRLTLARVARAMGISVGFLCDMEHGRKPMNAARRAQYDAILQNEGK